jgi:hypothetical protein
LIFFQYLQSKISKLTRFQDFAIMETDAGDSQDNRHNEDEQFYNDENSENFDQDEGEHDG